MAKKHKACKTSFLGHLLLDPFLGGQGGGTAPLNPMNPVLTVVNLVLLKNVLIAFMFTETEFQSKNLMFLTCGSTLFLWLQIKLQAPLKTMSILTYLVHMWKYIMPCPEREK